MCTMFLATIWIICINRVHSMLISVLIINVLTVNVVNVRAGDVIYFGITTGDRDHSETSNTVVISLWTESTLYVCDFDGMDENTQYICNEDIWNITTACDDGSSDYKLVFDNNDTDDAVHLDSAFLRLNDANYSIDAWCVPGEADLHSSTEYSSNECQTGYIAYDDECIDSEDDDCAPGIEECIFIVHDSSTNVSITLFIRSHHVVF